ncbi:hypothetical protein HPB50_020789 [Hyalomma asiaticum]|uniref:Uncharacterized protein n=1 Tax=Hyalomma asiaticum TaxID=266040 RepID=A0ACB7TS52_HYAAI|nr:hypothetical protein HPB50_020789 [Hyalomma asiaticum]
MAQSAVSNTYEVTEAIIISVAARAARRKLVDFPPTPWLPRMRRRRRVLACVNGTLVAIRKPQGLGIGDTAIILSRKGYYTLNVMVDSGDWTLVELCMGVPPAEQSGDEQALEQ